MKPGCLITIEGGEGAGKSTLIEVLAEQLTNANIEVRTTYEPGDTELGRALRARLLHGCNVAAMTELCLYLADRAEHLAQVIEPALAAGAWVLCDRYSDATIAYQGYGRGLDVARVAELCRLAAPRQPRRTLLLDLPPSLGLARAAGRGGEADRFEGEATVFHERVREGYLALARQAPSRFRVLDAAQPPKQLAAQAWNALGDLVEQSGP